MPVHQMIQWVLVPGGFHPDGTLRLSVFVAPRLMSDEEDENALERFPDFLDWPSRLATATFTVRTDEPHGSDQPATLVGSPPESALWRSLFGPLIPVRSYVPDDHGASEVVSYPARQMSASARAGYTAAAAATPSELPTSETIPFGEDSTARFEDFHRRARASEPVDSPEALRAKVDFHQMLSVLGDHPVLLRRLGLVFELSVPGELVPPNDMDAAIRLTPAWQSSLPPEVTTDVKPFTWYVRKPEIFTAAARGVTGLGSLARGLIKLPEDQFSVEQVDLDGAVHKALAMDPADADGFPALRTSGFSLVRDDRAAFLTDDLTLAARREEDLAQHRTIDLHADDLVRGHRLDVFDETTQRWFSLHERAVDYTVPGDPATSVQGVPAEGFFQVSLTRPAGTDTGRLYVHERIITWDGWSLSGPRPGKAISEDPRSPDPDTPATLPKRVPNTVATSLPLEIEAVVRPGSLPRLRFGRGYRFRVRAVDLTGNGPTCAEAPDLGPGFQLPGEGPITFHRFEPVPAPPLLPRARLNEGETVDRLVIRSTPGQSVAEYVAAFNHGPLVAEGRHRPYQPADERHLVAPKAALQLVEWHGMLDAAIGSPDPVARRRTYELARREKGTLDDPALPEIEIVRVTRPDGSEVERYVTHTGETVAVPYLPDPLASGVVFHGLPGAETFEVSWNGPEWHEPRSLRLRIVDGDDPPHLDEAARVLTVHLPQGEVATVRVSSRAGADPAVMGVLAWCRDELPPEEFAKVLRAAEENRHWMITPWREITLVHAVQRPLIAPDLELFPAAEREPGDTYVHLFGSAAVSAATTERIDMVAEWQETVDDPGLGEPVERACSAHVFRLPLALADEFGGDSHPEEVPCKLGDSSLTFNTMAGASLTPPVPAKHDFGDTRHRSIRYRAVAASAFREYFPPEFADSADLSVEGRPVTFNVLSSAPPAAPRVLYAIPTQAWETSSDGQTITRRRRGGGVRIYLDRPWYSSGEGELLGVLVARETPLPHEAAYSMVSLIGRDPVYVSESLTSLTADSFPANVASATGLTLPAALDHLGVTVLGHRPQYDAETGRWFCDVDIDTQDAYLPFVRLALTRYQPDSLPGLHLSPIVLSDIVRLLPDRTFTVTKQSPLGVSVSGPAYQEPEGARMIAQLERRDPAVPDDVIGWRVIPGTLTQIRPQFDAEGRPLASLGEVPVPPRPPGEIRRLTVMEFERLPSDTADGVTDERLVYCDSVEL